MITHTLAPTHLSGYTMTSLTESDLQQQLATLGELRAAIGKAIVGQQDVVEQLLKNDGVVIRGTLGLETQSLTPQVAQGLGLSESRGAVVTRVYAGSGAAAAGASWSSASPPPRRSVGKFFLRSAQVGIGLVIWAVILISS